MTDIKDLNQGDKIRYLGRKKDLCQYYHIPHATLKVGDIVMFKYYNYADSCLECEDVTGFLHDIYPVTSNWELVKEPETITLQTKEDFLGKVFRTKDEDEWNYVQGVLLGMGFNGGKGWLDYETLRGYYREDGIAIGASRLNGDTYLDTRATEVYILNKPTYTAEVLQPKAPSEKEALQQKLKEAISSMKELEDKINNMES